MFYFDEFNEQKILRSDLLDKYKEVDAFFTTKIGAGAGVGVNISELVEHSSSKIQGVNISGLVEHSSSKMQGVNISGLAEQSSSITSMPDFAKRILTPVQTHSDHIEIVDERDNYPDTDGLILKEKDTAIYLRFADCTPLIFYDTVNKIGAISHAGWRGTAEKIGVKTIGKMGINFGTKPENIIAIIGPAISICCYEVSEEVRDKLLSTVKNTENLFNNRNVDLKKINARQITEAGVKNIDICPYCTSCNNDLFYSYRKENGTKERHFAVLRLNSVL